MKYACFIVTYKRPDTVTPKMLREHGYSGEYFLVVSDNDPCIEEYKSRYGDSVLVFHKPDYAWIDTCDLDPSLDFANIARYAAHDFARELKYDAWCMLDDDLSDIKYRSYNENHSLKTYEVTKLDALMDACFEFVMKFPPGTIFGFLSACLMFPGRIDKFERFWSQISFRRTSDPYLVKGRFYDDFTEVLDKNNIGEIAFVLHEITYKGDAYDASKVENDVSGGMLQAYEKYSRYARRFMSLMIHPCGGMGCQINKAGCLVFPKGMSSSVQILPERFKKQ